MALFDRIRPRWRHADPAVRAAAVREMAAGDQERLADLARTDPHPDVRRAAAERLDDWRVLAERAERDEDAGVRDVAGARLRDRCLAIACSDAATPERGAALAHLVDVRSLVAVACGAVDADVRRAAVERVTGDRPLRDVARDATDAAVRAAALARIADPAVLRSIAAGDGPTDTALAALDRIDDVATLQAVATTRTAAKAVRQRARARLGARADETPPPVKQARGRQLELAALVATLQAGSDVVAASEQARAAEAEWRRLASVVEPRPDVAARFAAACEDIATRASAVAAVRSEIDHDRAMRDEGLAARRALVERLDALDGAGVADAVAAARAAWAALPAIADAEAAALDRRFAAACDRAAARGAALRTVEQARAAAEALLAQGEAMVSAAAPPSTKAWRAMESRWAARPARGDGDDAFEPRFAALRDRLGERRREAERRRGELERANVERLTALCARVEGLIAGDAVKATVARRELRELEAALADPGPLPASERRAAWLARLGDARERLLRRLGEEERAEEWRRWANTRAQEELIARVEALLASEDLAEATRQLGVLQDEWARVATASPEKSQALWERFRTARNALRKRCDAYLAENLEKKRALCAQVAGVGESTDWNETAALIKRVQSEWKAIGPVPGRHAKALWEELRAPCDRFFARRKEQFDRRDAERRSSAAEKVALCEQAEALADSTDWDATTAAMKALQARWKETGAPPREQAEALWRRFRAACDRFFDRSRRRDELEREALVAGAEGACAALEAALGAGDGADGDGLGRAVDAAWGAWLQVGEPIDERHAGLRARLHAACEAVAAAQPHALAGTRLDPAVTGPRREKLCVRAEGLAPSAPSAPRQQSVAEMALALRERLAANTIAGKERPRGGRGSAAADVERLRLAWAHLGPPLDAAARRLAERFEGALARIPVAG